MKNSVLSGALTECGFSNPSTLFSYSGNAAAEQAGRASPPVLPEVLPR